MSIEQDVKEVIAQTLSVTPDEVALDATLAAGFSMDSTEFVDLRVALEKKFDLKFDANEVSKNSTPKDIIALVASKKGQS